MYKANLAARNDELMSSSASSCASPTLCGWCLTEVPYTIACLNCSTMVLWIALHLRLCQSPPLGEKGRDIGVQSPPPCMRSSAVQQVCCSREICPSALCKYVEAAASPTSARVTHQCSIRVRSWWDRRLEYDKSSQVLQWRWSRSCSKHIWQEYSSCF